MPFEVAAPRAQKKIGVVLTLKKMAGLSGSVEGTYRSDSERGSERNRRALLTSGIAMIARVVQIATLFITVRLTLHYLGNERFGLWMTISSILAMAGFADFGLGLGVLNTVAAAHGRDDVAAIRRAVSSGFFALNTIAVTLLLTFFAMYAFIDWAGFFHVSSPLARSEAGPAVAVFATCFALNISMDVVQRVQLGLQQGYHYGLWQLCGTITGFIGVLLSILLHVSLPVLVLAMAGGPVLTTILNTVHFFGFVRRDLLPDRALVSGATIRNIAKTGGMFFILQIVVAISFSADNFIIARTLGAAAVAQYSIPQRLFSIIGVVVTILVAPLWPAYAEAVSRGDLFWVRRTLLRTLLGVFAITSICALFLFFMSHRLLLLWVGPSVSPSPMLMLGLALLAVLQSVSGTLQSFLNGAGIIRFQLATHIVFGLSCLLLKLWSLQRYGAASLPWVTIVTYGSLVVLANAVYLPGCMARMLTKNEEQQSGASEWETPSIA